MILGYRLEAEDGDPSDAGPVLRPFFELERLVPASWYINAIAIFEPWRGRGVGARLLAAAAERARASGCAAMSVQTFSETPRAEAFYTRHGFLRIASRALPEDSPCVYTGETVLLTRATDGGRDEHLQRNR